MQAMSQSLDHWLEGVLSVRKRHQTQSTALADGLLTAARDVAALRWSIISLLEGRKRPQTPRTAVLDYRQLVLDHTNQVNRQKFRLERERAKRCPYPEACPQE